MSRIILAGSNLHKAETFRNNQLGKKYDGLTIIGDTHKRSDSSVVWLCRCDCNQIVEVESHKLYNEGILDCGCGCSDPIKQDFVKHSIQKYGFLNLIEDTGQFEDCRAYRSRIWKCECQCGQIIYVSTWQIMSGYDNCGCKRKNERLKKATEQRIRDKKDMIRITYKKLERDLTPIIAQYCGLTIIESDEVDTPKGSLLTIRCSCNILYEDRADRIYKVIDLDCGCGTNKLLKPIIKNVLKDTQSSLTVEVEKTNSYSRVYSRIMRIALKELAANLQ